MEPFIIMAVVIIVAVVAFMFFKFRSKNCAVEETSGKLSVVSKSKTALAKTSSYEMTVKFENLPALTEEEQTRLVEVKDKKLLAKIDSAVPGTMQAVANAGAV